VTKRFTLEGLKAAYTAFYFLTSVQMLSKNRLHKHYSFMCYGVFTRCDRSRRSVARRSHRVNTVLDASVVLLENVLETTTPFIARLSATPCCISSLQQAQRLLPSSRPWIASMSFDTLLLSILFSNIFSSRRERNPRC